MQQHNNQDYEYCSKMKKIDKFALDLFNYLIYICEIS